MFTMDSSFLYQETLKREKEKTKVRGSEIIWKIKIVFITRNTSF
jgi:hypothetical protein